MLAERLDHGVRQFSNPPHALVVGPTSGCKRPSDKGRDIPGNKGLGLGGLQWPPFDKVGFKRSQSLRNPLGDQVLVQARSEVIHEARVPFRHDEGNAMSARLTS